MKQKLKKGFAWLKSRIVRFIASALLGLIFGLRGLTNGLIFGQGEHNSDDNAGAFGFFEGIIYFLFFLLAFYLLVAWLYSDNKTEETK